MIIRIIVDKKLYRNEKNVVNFFETRRKIKILKIERSNLF
jgi:hypothetical protein